MKSILKKFFSIALISLLVIGIIIPCSAASLTGKITVILEDKDKNQINGQEVLICQIAKLNNSGYYPTAHFEDSGISIAGILNNPDQATAKSVMKYATDNNIPSISAISGEGKVEFNNLDIGIWLVYCKADGKYTFNPYIVLLPYASNGELYYEVSASPKIGDNKPNLLNIYVIKRWDDKNNAAKKRPNRVLVELLDKNTVIEMVELNETNGWSHTFKDIPKDGSYSVREKAINNYTPHYSGDVNNGFIITNTYSGEKLPQTGQYWWPIAVLAVAGIALVLLGLGVRKNDKKK